MLHLATAVVPIKTCCYLKLQQIVPVKLAAVRDVSSTISENPVADKIPVEGTKDKLALETL
jgi:hypothetical protein